MNILITGGCGFIGSAVCRNFAKQTDINLINLDALTYAAEPRSLTEIEANSNYTFVRGDINDTNLVVDLLNKHQITGIMHLAAESHVDRSIDGPAAFRQCAGR